MKLVKLRNPWGGTEWSRDWSDSSSLWTPELKQQVGFTKKEDGIFHMSIQDYLRFFQATHICAYKDNYTSYFTQSTSGSEGKLFRIYASTPSQLFFSVSQLASRNDAHIKSYKLSYAKLIVGRVRDGSEDGADMFPYECVGVSSHTYEEDVTVESKASVKPGYYVAYVEIDWNNPAVCN